MSGEREEEEAGWWGGGGVGCCTKYETWTQGTARRKINCSEIQFQNIRSVAGSLAVEMHVSDFTLRVINQTDCRADTTAKGFFFWANQFQLLQLVFFRTKVTMRKTNGS